LAPLWWFIRSNWILIIAHGIIVAASAFPLYAIANLKFKEKFVPFLIVFSYLSYSILQRILTLNFSVEVFYPLIIFSLIYFVLTKRTLLMLLFVFLAFLIKDDAPIYIAALGGFLCLTKKYRRYGFIILGLSVAAFFIIMKVIVPQFGRMGQRLAENYPRYGKTVWEVAGYLISHPFEILKNAFYPWEKLETYFDIFKYVIFIPFFTPWALLIFASIYPVMMTNAPGIFLSLDCHYSAPVVPFVFVALVFGLSNLARWAGPKRQAVLWILLLGWVVMNGGHYSVESVTRETLKTVSIARSIPPGCNVVASGAILPYLGYRKYNFYIAPPFQLSTYDGKEQYLKPDYCFLVDNIELYPVDKGYIEKILNALDIEGQRVMEIGPGEGVISEYIGARAKHLCCVEYDERFCGLLKEKFRKKNNVEIVHNNILKFPISKLGSNLVVFGNVPYRVSSSIVEYLIQNKTYINKAYLTFQKEFVQKLMACAGEKQYGFLSCYIQYYAKVKKIFNVPAGAFWPKPKVDSSFVEIEFYKKLPCKVRDEELLFKVIRKAFSNRRKKISNSLKLPEDIEINYNLRPQDLSLEDYIKISKTLRNTQG